MDFRPAIPVYGDENIAKWTPQELLDYVRVAARSDAAFFLSTPSTGAAAAAFTDGVAPTSSPTPTVVGYYDYLSVRWTAITNADSVGYQVHLSTSTGFTPSGGTLHGYATGTEYIIAETVGGTALLENTPYYVKLIAFDDDGSAAAGSQGTASLAAISRSAGEDALYAALKAKGGTGLPLAASITTAGVDNANTITATTQRLAGAAFMVERPVTVTGMMVRVITTAATGTQNYTGAGLFSMTSTGGWTFLKDTGANNTTWLQSTGMRQIAFSSTTALVPGTVYVMALIAGMTTTLPVLVGHALATGNGAETTYMRYAAHDTYATRGTAMTDQAIGSLAAYSNIPWMALY